MAQRIKRSEFLIRELAAQMKTGVQLASNNRRQGYLKGLQEAIRSLYCQ